MKILLSSILSLQDWEGGILSLQLSASRAPYHHYPIHNIIKTPVSPTYKCDMLQDFCVVFNLWPTSKVFPVGTVELWRKDLVWIPMARRHQMPTCDTVKLVWKEY